MIGKIGLLAALLATIFFGPSDTFARGGGHGGGGHSGGGHSSNRGGSHTGSYSSRSSHSSSKKTEHVGSYNRKDGKYVKQYDRHPAGTKPEKKTYQSHSGTRSRSTSTVTTQHFTSAQRDHNGRLKRSAHAKNEFKKTHPCPSTGRSTGACHGYVIDHIKALKHGGADAPSNMQWQTVANAKAKDKWE